MDTEMAKTTILMAKASAITSGIMEKFGAFGNGILKIEKKLYLIFGIL